MYIFFRYTAGYIIDLDTNLARRITREFWLEYFKEYHSSGARQHHFYAMDTFNEMPPPIATEVKITGSFLMRAQNQFF